MSRIFERQPTFTWNAFNRLVTATVGGETVASYACNALGQRMRKTVRGVTTWYAYGLNGELLAELDDTGTVQKEYVWLDGSPLAMLQEETIVYLHTDHLGTLRVGTDTNGTVVWRWRSDAFGATPPDEDSDGDDRATVVNLRFPGQYADGETGLYYNYFRYYDPYTGRYISSDPIGLNAGLNTYAYVGNSPLRWYDRHGLEQGAEDNGDWISPLTNGAVNFTLAAGGWGHIATLGFSIESGFAMDTNGTGCFYIRKCSTAGPGLAGTLGMSAGIGEGKLYSGKYWGFGPMAAGGALLGGGVG